MTTPITTTTSNSQMHNDIMAAGSRDHPPMLTMGRYAHWQSRFMRYVDTRPNSEELRKCILQGPIGDDIYSTVDAYKTAKDMWVSIERLHQGESLSKQDVKTNLFWESGKFTSRDRESIESYYSMFYKMISEMVRNQLEVATMQVNVQFLEQLQPEWSRFVNVVKQTIDLDKESYHKLFDILKQYQKEVNEIRAEKIARNANPLALIYKPTNNNLRTSSNTRFKNADTSLRHKNDNQTRQFGNQRTVTVVGAKETVGIQVVQQTGTQCFNCKELGHFAKECRKPKWAKDYNYHKETMLLCKQAEKNVPLCAKQTNWLDDTDEELDEQELEAHYMYMTKIQEVHTPNSGPTFDAEPLEKVHSENDYNVFVNESQHSEQPVSINNTYVVEKVDSIIIPDSLDMCDKDNQDDQNIKECDDERAVIANLIVNLKLDTDENKKI
ncbi:retrotransposon protein, putative, unclassified [Tanacetum coccineum]|uniref:Retrotransposon protein, putative, unclassified n=1 Tax=Tanacetum coccineum TaxID=301880 RepID=A0ABQ5CEY7_9ASTR